MHRKFPSLAFGKDHAYAFDSQAFDMKAPMHDHFRMFKTYGDGLCQHSGDWSITVEYLADYLASLADVITKPEEAEDKDELLDKVRYDIADRPHADVIEFAAAIRWVEGKRRYYSLKELKISSSESKRHDKRYEEISDVHDGTPSAIFRVLMLEHQYADGIKRYSYAEALRDWLLAENNRGYMELPGEFLKWSKDRHDALNLHSAYMACWDTVQAYLHRYSAQGHLNNYKRTLEQPAQKKEVA